MDGPQNAVGLDALKAHGICCRAAREHGGIVAPPDYWHVHEIGLYASSWAEENVGQARSWLTAMPPWMHLTGHYGPNWIDILQPHFAMRIYGLPDFEANSPSFDEDGQATGDHAGKVETSLLWALEPECVDVSRFPTKDAPGPHFTMGQNARESNRQSGERMVNDEVRWLGDKTEELLSDYARHAPTTRSPLTFMQIETIWQNEVFPKLADFKTMDYLERTPPPESSMWRINYEIPEMSQLS